MKLCVDAGGTYFRYELFDGDKKVAQGCDSSIGVGIGFWLEKSLQNYPEVKKVGIGYAGQVHNGVILAAPNMTIDKNDIKHYFEKHFGITLFIQNDLECAVLAEAQYYQSSDICALYLGSGMGLGVVSGGKLLKGHSGASAEIGHIPYKKSPFVCGCGKDNCVELFASGTGLIKFKEYFNLDPTLCLQELRAQNSEIYASFEDALMHAIGVGITLFNPEYFVLGGGIFQNDAVLFEIVVQRFKEFAMPLSAKTLKIVPTHLHNAVLAGAKMLEENL